MRRALIDGELYAASSADPTRVIRGANLASPNAVSCATGRAAAAPVGVVLDPVGRAKRRRSHRHDLVAWPPCSRAAISNISFRKLTVARALGAAGP